jgi:hypothetical protein
MKGRCEVAFLKTNITGNDSLDFKRLYDCNDPSDSIKEPQQHMLYYYVKYIRLAE